jgi:hypothetical protein
VPAVASGAGSNQAVWQPTILIIFIFIIIPISLLSFLADRTTGEDGGERTRER